MLLIKIIITVWRNVYYRCKEIKEVHKQKFGYYVPLINNKNILNEIKIKIKNKKCYNKKQSKVNYV